MEKSITTSDPGLAGGHPRTTYNNSNETEFETSVGAIHTKKELNTRNIELHKNNQWKTSELLTVSAQNVCKSYEKGKPILSNLCMSVKKGTIYGLLGSSGCGKTTLLSCIVGLKKWDSGEILVFGKQPNGVPGRRVGYMPQDIALHDQISIRETITYYGRLYGMADAEVEHQWQWLVSFLQLPSKFKLIKDLSGGQKRRVSLATTLLHSPELILLDEPTVGLDPVLRESIWQHLYNIVQTGKKTVIITTHYIEEARCSDTIGVMRKGRLIIENAPNALLKEYRCDLLEQVVVKLCRKDERILGTASRGNGFNNNMTTVIVQSHTVNVGKCTDQSQSGKNSNNISRFPDNVSAERNQNKEASISNLVGRIRALSTIIWLMFMRHPAFFSMILFLPTLQLILTLAVVGTHPKDLKFGVVNQDILTLEHEACFNYQKNVPTYVQGELSVAKTSCDFKHLSCLLITELSVSGTLNLIPMESTEFARKQVEQGSTWGYFNFPRNYSHHLESLIVAQKFAEDETLIGSRVHLTMDMSHYLGAAMAIQTTYEAYQKFVEKMANSCDIDPREFQLPLEYRKPVYGNNDATFHEYVIPVIILTVIFEIPMLVTSIMFINDRKQGTLDRARVAGLRFKEVMVSHFLTQGSVILGQSIICSVVLHYFYDFRVVGCYWLYFVFCIIAGLCGESLGLLLGVLFEEEVEALMFGIFLGPTLLMYEGCIWPIQGMSTTVRSIARTFPTTLMIESARGVIYKGLELTHGAVWPGVAIITGWTILFWVVSVIVFIKKQK